MASGASYNEIGQWSREPRVLVNKRVRVEVTPGTSAWATVISYDDTSGKHTVIYDDGDRRTHDLQATPFWHSNVRYAPTGRATAPIALPPAPWGSGAVSTSYTAPTQFSAYGWKPYVSRTPNATTLVTFHCLLHSRFLREGEVVALRGNPEAFGEGAAGIPMIRDPTDERLWHLEVQLPFSLMDSCQLGMFKFRYKIAARDGTEIPEGQLDRSETRLLPHFYHAFRTNYQQQRFRGSTTPPSREVLQTYARHELGCFSALVASGVAAGLAAQMLVTRFSDVNKSVVGSSRVYLEEVVNEFVLAAEHDGTVLAKALFLSMLGMLGTFGRSTSERVYGGVYGGMYGGMYGGQGGAKPQYRTAPRPGPWCLHLLKVDVPDWFAEGAKALLGNKYAFALSGLCEAVDRLSEHGSLAWLRIWPLIKQHKAMPKIKSVTNEIEEYEEILPDLLEAIEAQNRISERRVIEKREAAALEAERMERSVQQALADATTEGAGADASSTAMSAGNQAISNSDAIEMTAAREAKMEEHAEGGDELIGLSALEYFGETAEAAKEPDSVLLAQHWLAGLIRYAPHVEHVFDICVNHAGNHLEHLVPVVAKTLQSFWWTRDSELAAVEKLLVAAPVLQCPQIAAAMLRCEMEAHLKDQTLRLVQGAIAAQAHFGGEVPPGDSVSSALEAATTRETAPAALHAKGFAVGEPHLSGVWLDLNAAAKDWLRNFHAEEPKELRPPKEEEAPAADDWYAAYVRPKKQKRKRKGPTPEDIELGRRRCLHAAVQDVGGLMVIPFFHERCQSGIFFEFRRCWFMKGPLRQVFAALCHATTNAEHAGPGPVQAFLQDCCARLVVEAALGSTFEMSAVLEILLGDEGVAGEADDDLLFVLAMAATYGARYEEHMAEETTPKVAAVLQREELWATLLRRLCTKGLAGDNRLASLLSRVRDRLEEVATAAAENRLGLAELHVVLDAKPAFLRLLEAAQRSQCLTETVLTERGDALCAFDFALAHLQCFAGFWCGCGVRCDAEVIKAQVETVRRTYITMTGSDLHGALDGPLPAGEAAWLFGLRSSELFLRMWSESGKELARTRVMEEPQGTGAGGDSDELHGQILDQVRNLFATEDDDEGAPAASAAPLPPHEHRIFARLEDVVLTPSDVVDELLPRARDRWDNLAHRISTGEIGFTELQESFSDSMQVSQVEEELLLLVPGDAMRDLALSRLKDFLLLRRLCVWLPAMLKLRALFEELVDLPTDEDPLAQLLLAAGRRVDSGAEDQTLATMPELVGAVREILQPYPAPVLDFLVHLTEDANFVGWLLARDSTEEFNQLLQVVRGYNEDPRLLSSIASLVTVRTLLIKVVYGVRYYSLSALLAAFRDLDLGSGDAVDDASPMWHIANIVVTFETLVEVFEKQTKSPGIKSCYDLAELREKGYFVLVPHNRADDVVRVEIRNEGAIEVEKMDYLLDLRAKLLMTEVPAEVEAEFGVAEMVEAFVGQLQLLGEMRDLLVSLSRQGHISYQAFRLERKFALGGRAALVDDLALLRADAEAWAVTVKAARDAYYFLNAYTMLELLRMRACLESWRPPAPPGSASDAKETSPPAAPSPLPPSSPDTARASQPPMDPSVAQLVGMGFAPGFARAALRETGGSLDHAINFCLANAMHAERVAREEDESLLRTQGRGDAKSASNAIRASEPAPAEDPKVAFTSMLYAVTTSLEEGAAERAMATWASLPEKERGAWFLQGLGKVLNDVFSGRSEKSWGAAALSRSVSGPSAGAANAADLLVLVEAEGAARLPIFVTVCNEPARVLPTVLSVYYRRRRLPEPSEVVFCSGADTVLEDVELLLLRFLRAKTAGRGDHIFCVANLHQLSYTQQCRLVDRLRNLLTIYGTDYAATLLLVAGKPRQLTVAALSSQQVALPPLANGELLRITEEALAQYGGRTCAVASTINGGGKSHYIAAQVATAQAQGEQLAYERVMLREATTASGLLERLLAIRDTYPSTSVAHHVDIGHILPPAANTLLFQLLVVGVLRDPHSGRVFSRRRGDQFFLEVPNSPRDATRAALHLTEILPLEIREVSADRLDVRRIVQTSARGALRLEPNDGFHFVAAFLRAQRLGKLRPNSEAFDVTFDAHTEALNRRRIFDELRLACCDASGPSPQPSWALLHNLVSFLQPQLQRVELYPLLDLRLLVDCGMGLETFKDAFIAMLVATAKGFALRSVPQVPGVGPPAALRGTDRPSATVAGTVPPPPPATEGEVTAEALDSDSASSSPPRPSLFGQLSDLEDRGASSGSESDAPPPNPDLWSNPSSGSVRYRDAAQRDSHAVPAPNFLAHRSSEIAARFRRMARWDETDHPVAIFKPEAGGGIAGINILALNPEFLDRYINDALHHALAAQLVDLNPDWETLSNAEAVELLRFSADEDAWAGGLAALEIGYVLTVDNLLKMISILYRLRFGLPVVIMGETGCGKSTLIRNMCAILGYPLHVLNVHGGMEDHDIKAWMQEKIAAARSLSVNLILLLDEVNTCNSMGLFKEIICDRTMEGAPLPPNLQLICACNPYRKRTAGSLCGDEAMAGLAFEFAGRGDEANVGTGIKDPLSELVYRVHPLPESMIDHIYDFGSLAAHTEKLYIKAMLRQKLAVPQTAETSAAPANVISQADEGETEATRARAGHRGPFEEFVEVFAELICSAQECIRDLHGGERSSASLRDVSRCVKVYHWFAEYLSDNQTTSSHSLAEVLAVHRRAQPTIRRATCLALAYCYYARLPRREREYLVDTICVRWQQLQRVRSHNFYGRGGGGALRPQTPPRCAWLHLDSPVNFVKTLRGTQEALVSAMHLGDGIALNEALCENLFMILISLLNSIPIFVIGKPGSSKSLAMNLIQSNLNGDASENAMLKALPAVEVFSYQCSPLSTSAGIQQTFDAARRYRRETTGTVVVVLLDEVGLAEQSPWLPLKVLHSVLDTGHAGESLVGISNWALDPAKMNRAVHLYRPAPTVEDLSLTAEGMVQAASLRGYLQSLARAYSRVYHGQEKDDFWGLREFYATVKAINAQLQRRRAAGEAMVLDERMLLDAIRRNYGGRPEKQSRAVVDIFFDELGLPRPSSTAGGEYFAVSQLIHRNLQEPEARHLMLLTKNNAALGLLFDGGILSHDRTEIIFGSDFPLDQTDLQVCLSLQRVKLCMAEGITVVLVHGEALYESLYDLLNQHYSSYGGQLYVRLAFGSSTRLCPVHRAFRVVVVVETLDAYTKLAPPLLNRFEKQVFETRDVLHTTHRPLVERLQRFVEAFAGAGSDGQSGWRRRRAAFCGFHSDLLASLVASVDAAMETENFIQGALAPTARGSEAWAQALFQRCVDRLMYTATPEAVCRLRSYAEMHDDIQRAYDVDCANLYFRVQTHGSLAAFLAKELVGSEVPAERRDSAQTTLTFVSSYAPLDPEVARLAAASAGLRHVSLLQLHDLDAEADLRRCIGSFFEDGLSGSLLLLQCDPLAASLRRVEHAKFVLEKAVADAQELSSKESEEAEESPESMEEKGYGHGEEGDGAEGSPLSPHAAELPAPNPKDPEPDGGSVPQGMHIVVLLHLSRGLENRWCVSHDARWRHVFVDAVAPAAALGLPEAEHLVGRSLSEVLCQLELGPVLRQCFRPSLARLSYRHARTNALLRDQIRTLLRCCEDGDFLGTVKELMKETMASGGYALDVAAAAEEDGALHLAGTFQAVLHQQILGAVACTFAIILLHMDRNAGLAMVLHPDLKELYLELLPRSFRDLAVRQRYESGDPRRDAQNAALLEVPSDGFGGAAFACRFPFSFYLRQVFEGIRHDPGIGRVTESTLARALVLLGIAKGVAQPMQEDHLRRYVHDLVAMAFPAVRGLPRDALTNLAWEYLAHVAPEEEEAETRSQEAAGIRGLAQGSSSAYSDNCTPRTLAAWHHRSWRAEQHLTLYLRLLDLLPTSHSPVTALLGALEGHIDDCFHASVTHAFFTALDPITLKWTTTEGYGPWLADVVAVSPLLDALVDLIDPAALTTMSIAKKAEELGLWAAIVKQVALPLALAPTHVYDVMTALAPLQLRSGEAMRALLRVLARLSREVMRGTAGDELLELKCPISLERMVDPVVAADGHAYDRSSIAEWIDRGGATVRSPITNLPLAHTHLVPDVARREQLEAAQELDLREFFEDFVLETVLGGAKAELELGDGIADELVKLVIGTHDIPNVDVRYVEPVLPGTACKLALLRELLRRHEGARLGPALEALRSQQPDHELLAMYVTVIEEAMDERGGEDPKALAAEHRAALLEETDGPTSVLDFLQATAAARVHLRRSARGLGEAWEAQEARIASGVDLGKASGDGNFGATGQWEYRYAEALLAPCAGSTPRLGSLRFFLAKEVERRWGVGFLRRLLKGIAKAPWVLEWNEADASLRRFLGASHLPHDNPLSTISGFRMAQTALSHFLANEDSESLGTALRRLRRTNGDAGAQGALLAGIFHEFCLLRLVGAAAESLQRSSTQLLRLLRSWDWISSEQAALMGLFTGGADERLAAWEAMGLEISPGMKNLAALFSPGPHSTPDAVRPLRLLAHVAALALSVAPSCAWALLRGALGDVAAYREQFLPGMPQDALKMAQVAMGGRWYRCANGHPYYVDLCGRPTELLSCAECGLPIGGTDHALLADNVDIGGVGEALYQRTHMTDTTVPGYGLRSAAEENTADPFPTCRTLGPFACRTTRLLLHASHVLGGAARIFMGGDAAAGHAAALAWTADVQSIFATDVGAPSDPAAFFLDHVLADVAAIKERVLNRPLDDTYLLLHAVLYLGGGRRPEGVALDLQPINAALEALRDDGADLATLPTPAARAVWEDAVNVVVDYLIAARPAEASVEAARGWFTSAGDSSTENAMQFVAELKEHFRPESLAPAERAAGLPSLWRHRRFFRFDDLVQRLRSGGGSGEAPLLAWVNSKPGEVESLKRLPGVFKWLSLLLDRFNLKIDRDVARRMTVAEVLESAPADLRASYEESFADFAACWTACWPQVQTYGCTPIPSDYADLEMSPAAPVCFCLPCEEDEGVCPTALVQYLVHLHSDLCEMTREHALRHRSSAGASLAEVASAHLTPSHCAAFSERRFAKYLRDRCATADGSVPLVRAEKALVARHLSAMRPLRLELRLVTYSTERYRHGGLQRLRQKIRQEPLPTDVAAQVRRELSAPARAAPIRAVLETAVAFLAAAAGASGQRLGEEVGNMPLGDYAKTFLLLDEGGLGRAAEDVRLRHLEDLLQLVEELCGAGVFARVHSHYKEELPSPVAKLLAAQAAAWPLEAFLPVFATYLKDNLAEAHTDPNGSLKASLEWVELEDVWLQELPWFREFPEEVRMKHAVAAFELLEGRRALSS